MKTHLHTFFFLGLSLSLFAQPKNFNPQVAGAEVGKWTTDLAAADELYANNKELPMLIWFSGLSWNPPDRIFLEQIATSQDWLDYAQNRLILINVDNSKKLFIDDRDEPTSDKNLTLARMYGIETLPTFALVLGEGEQLLAQEVEYDFGDTPADFIRKLELVRRRIQGDAPALLQEQAPNSPPVKSPPSVSYEREQPLRYEDPTPVSYERSEPVPLEEPAPVVARRSQLSTSDLRKTARNWFRPYDSTFKQNDWNKLVEFRESFSVMMDSLNRTLSAEDKRNQASRKFATFRIEMGMNILTFIDLPVSYTAVTTILGEDLLMSFPEDQRSRFVLEELIMFSSRSAQSLAATRDLNNPEDVEFIVSTTLVNTLKHWATDESLRNRFGPLRFTDLDLLIESILNSIE